MERNQTPKLEFRKTRDFGQLFTDVARFIKFNLKSILICVLFIPGPLFLIAGCFYGYMQAAGSDPQSLIGMGLLRDPWDSIMNLFSAMLPYFIFVFLGILTSTATINRYFILYQERGENNSIGVGDIIRHLPADVWRLFYNNLLLGLIMTLCLIPVALIATIPILGALAIVITLLLAGPQFAYAINAGSYLVLRDKILITKAISKAWTYMRGNYWWTWLIVVVAGLIVGIVGAIFTIPMSVLTVMNKLTKMNIDTADNNSLLYIILGAITILGPQLLTPITKLFSVLAYHSYEEAEEGMSLKQKIDQIGSD